MSEILWQIVNHMFMFDSTTFCLGHRDTDFAELKLRKHQV